MSAQRQVGLFPANSKLVILFFCATLMGGCDSSVSPLTSSSVRRTTSGDWTLDITVQMCDEFRRRVPAVGPFSVTFYGADGTRGYITRGLDSLDSFASLPDQIYRVTVRRNGCYDAHASSQYSHRYKHLSATLSLFPFFPSTTRIDSLNCSVNSVVPEVLVKLFASKAVPDGGFRAIVLFVNAGPYVGSDFGNYVFSMPWIYQQVGGTVIEIDDIYRSLRNAGFAPGMQVSLTARIMSGATTITADPVTGLSIYTNLENNTRAIASFILP